MKVWSRPKMKPENAPDLMSLSKWARQQDPIPQMNEDDIEDKGQLGAFKDNRPIEPEGKKLTRPGMFKWLIFLLLIGYVLLSNFRAPILTRIGNYLVVQHPLKKADIIVCLMGKPVERGLATAEIFKKGLASRILLAREELPDGYAVLGDRNVHYPESRDLLVMILKGLGVPRSACLVSDSFVESTFEEAKLIRKVVLEKGFRSLIIITSPTHTRRAWLTFKKVFAKDDVKIMVMPSQYSGFKPDQWWKTVKYFQEVIVEYQKLFYYTLKYF